MQSDKRVEPISLVDELRKVKEKEYVDEGDDVTIRCSACDMPLVQLVVTRSHVDVSQKIVAECCHCGDKSFVETINGMFALGACEGSSISTMDIIDQDTRDGIIFMDVLIKTKK